MLEILELLVALESSYDIFRHLSSSVFRPQRRYCYILSQVYFKNKLKLALIGQSLFGKEVYSHLQREGHRVVGVFTVPDKDGKADPLGEYTWEHWVKHSQGWWVTRAAFVTCDPYCCWDIIKTRLL